MGLPLKPATEDEESTVAQDAVGDEYTVDDLLQAARYGDLEDVKAILPQLSPNSQNAQGYSALHYASANGHLSIVQYLVANGADVNICNAENNSPLHWAALNGQLQVVEELISHGANACALNRYDRTPIDEALSRDHQAIVDAIATGTAAATLDETTITANEQRI